jgi:hypothetical protein
VKQISAKTCNGTPVRVVHKKGRLQARFFTQPTARKPGNPAKDTPYLFVCGTGVFRLASLKYQFTKISAFVKELQGEKHTSQTRTDTMMYLSKTKASAFSCELEFLSNLGFKNTPDPLDGSAQVYQAVRWSGTKATYKLCPAN